MKQASFLKFLNLRLFFIAKKIQGPGNPKESGLIFLLLVLEVLSTCEDKVTI